MTPILAGIEVLLLAASALLLVPLAVLTLQIVVAVWPGRRPDESFRGHGIPSTVDRGPDAGQ